ncbi:hypothetical protein BGZ47_010660 [Haplosporangium gracile]|nr:hypothetical protein BGZ47_010660 [Haplosporangium gracile]
MLNEVAITHDESLKLWTVVVCTTTDHSVFKDGMRSFPSGHASSECMCLTKRATSSRVSVLVLTAILVMVSCIEDYRHSVADLVKGIDGKVHEAGRLEPMTDIHPNEESIDETQ